MQIRDSRCDERFHVKKLDAEGVTRRPSNNRTYKHLCDVWIDSDNASDSCTVCDTSAREYGGRPNTSFIIVRRVIKSYSSHSKTRGESSHQRTSKKKFFAFTLNKRKICCQPQTIFEQTHILGPGHIHIHIHIILYMHTLIL